MSEFNDLIRDLQLIDVPLLNRDYTWCNKQPAPLFSKLDRCLLSPEWALMFPSITLTAMEMIVSDHVPLLLQYKTPPTKKAPFRLEKFWFQYRYAHEKVAQIWSSQGRQTHEDALQGFEEKAIMEAFFKHMKDLLGTQVHVLNFDPKTLYPEEPIDLDHLQN